MICIDGSEYGQTAIEKCAEVFSGTSELSIKVICVYEPPVPITTEAFVGTQDYYQYVSQEERRMAEDNSRNAQTKLRSLFPKARISAQAMKGKPEQVIVEEAEQWGADLIVVGSHGRGFWSRALLGSVSDFVAHHAPCSVGVVKR